MTGRLVVVPTGSDATESAKPSRGSSRSGEAAWREGGGGGAAGSAVEVGVAVAVAVGVEVTVEGESAVGVGNDAARDAVVVAGARAHASQPTATKHAAIRPTFTPSL